jgi:hypothetical protein
VNDFTAARRFYAVTAVEASEEPRSMPSFALTVSIPAGFNDDAGGSESN